MNDPYIPPQNPIPPNPPQGAVSYPEKQWAMFSHLVSLCGYIGIPFGHILGPLVMYLIKKDLMPFGSGQAKESLNFQISMTIYVIASIPLLFIIIGFVLIPALAIISIVFTIIAAVKANDGEFYRYPLTIRFVK